MSTKNSTQSKKVAKKVAKKKPTRKAAKAEVELSPARKVFQLRDYQEAVDQRLSDGILRQMLIWHRRAGKDITSLEIAGRRLEQRVGTYWHMFPKHVQARRALWTGVDAHTGESFLKRAFEHRDAIKMHQTDMLIEFECGSNWQLLGSDNYDRAVGSNVCGVVFSEWALCDPRAWEFIRPILAENNGWALFITTYRGRNHAYKMAQQLRGKPDWHVEELTVDHTKREDGSPVITPEQIQRERDGGMPEALIRQEFYCDPMAAVTGAVYGKQLAWMRNVGRAA